MQAWAGGGGPPIGKQARQFTLRNSLTACPELARSVCLQVARERTDERAISKTIATCVREATELKQWWKTAESPRCHNGQKTMVMAQNEICNCYTKFSPPLSALYSVYFFEDPFTLSAGYFSLLIWNFSATAFDKSMLHLSASLTRYIKTSLSSWPTAVFSLSDQPENENFRTSKSKTLAKIWT